MAEDGEQRQILVRPLQTNDIPFVVAFEQASFPPNEAATPEKIEYRIRTCPEMTLGLFEVDDNGEGSLLAMIHGTRTSDPVATEKSMSIGSHEPEGATAAIHSLCVHPGHRTRGLGTRVLKEYLVRMGKQRGIKRVTLIAHDELVPFYERYEKPL